MNKNLKAVMLGLALALPFSGATLAADTPAAATAGKRLQVVVQVSDNDQARWSLALSNVKNVQKDVGAKNVDIELVVYGPGIGMLKDDSLVANQVQEALDAGVKVIACRNTMLARHISEADMIPGISYVQAGVVEITRKQIEGYAYLRP